MLWITQLLINNDREAAKLDRLAAEEPSLAKAQDIAAQADRLRGTNKSRRPLGLPFARN